MKVLIVDDSKAMRMIIRRTLRQAGHENLVVLEASNGAEALGVVQESNPDLVLTDWNMPEMTGYELLQELRNSGSQARVGFVTSESTTQMREKAYGAGALFLIEKPFTADDFQQALDGIGAG